MPQPTDALDFRRAHESVVLDALALGHPLALAESYHRSVPAAHAVARRLMSGVDQVESLLLGVYTQLWQDTPSSGPLEGWVRRTTWALGVERLRQDGTAPASPSAAGLLPDLPAPDVRFLDAAERAIAELPDDERRALLLAHDKGVPSAGQESGATDALVRALVSLAGPETSAGDRAALHEDGCDDLPALGDWCLGVASAREETDINSAIEVRPGCAAKARSVRRGRRRIEGLPATPDMGQRILVTVLTAGAKAAALPPTPQPPVLGEDGRWDEQDDDVVIAVAGPQADIDPDADLVATGPLPQIGQIDPFQHEPDPTEAFSLQEQAHAEQVDTDDAGKDDSLGRGDDPADDPFRPLDQPAVAMGQSENDVPAPEGPTEDEAETNWRPDPGSTAELRLSDILAEGEDDDDPFAGMDEEDDVPVTPAGPGNPYAALQHLELDDSVLTPDRRTGQLVADEDLVGGYVEGQDAHAEGAPQVRAGGNAALLSWVLPIVGGSLLGILAAILYFGLPN
ncbi:MAG: RNA polymerase sigma factor [Euzebya sp.]